MGVYARDYMRRKPAWRIPREWLIGLALVSTLLFAINRIPFGNIIDSEQNAVPTWPINLNTATPAQLQHIPRIGPVTAAAIIHARPFSTVDELVQVNGIGLYTLEQIKSYVTVAPVATDGTGPSNPNP